jgi:hypothetical protein
MTNLYVDPEIDREVVTHSALKVFRRCPKQYDYKMIQRLAPKRLSKPLERGTWMHALLEDHHRGKDWRIEHAKRSRAFNEMFDEEKDYFGDLPTELETLMEAYLWYYEDDPVTCIETEYTIEVELPNGVVYRGRVDMLAEDQFGLWIWDHKTHKTLPDMNFRLLDGQSGLYLWAALRKKLGVQGFKWNYLVTKPPSKPKALKDRSRLSKVMGETDYVTFKAGVQELMRTGALSRRPTDLEDIKGKLKYLKTQKYKPGEPQTSPFFRRDTLEKQDDMLHRVAQENYHTVQRIQKYPFHKQEAVERVVDRSCTFTCSYVDLCTVELMGGNSRALRTNNYRERDPMYYYFDEKEGVKD